MLWSCSSCFLWKHKRWSQCCRATTEGRTVVVTHWSASFAYPPPAPLPPSAQTATKRRACCLLVLHIYLQSLQQFPPHNTATVTELVSNAASTPMLVISVRVSFFAHRVILLSIMDLRDTGILNLPGIKS